MDQDLEDLQRQIKELTTYMRDLTNTVMSLDASFGNKFEKSVSKNTDSVKDNTKAIDKHTKSVEKGTQIVDEHGQAIRSETKARKEAEKAHKANTKAQQETYVYQNKTRDAFTDLSRELSTTAGVAGRMSDAVTGLAGQSMLAQNSMKLLLAGVKGAAAGAVSMGKDLYSGKRGAAVAAKALSSFADELGSAAQGIGMAMMFIPGLGLAAKAVGVALGVAGMALKTYAKYNELAAEQVDALFKSFRTLSQSGVADNLDQVFSTLQELGMTVAELDEFNDLLSKNSITLARFGSDAADGAKQFAKVAGGLYKSDLGYQLEMLGLTAKEQREAALTYMSIQSRTGALQLKSTGQLIEESAKFAKELDLAARITGQTREEQAKARESAMTEERFRAAVVEARARGDAAQLARLQNAADLAAMMRALGDTTGATGTLQIAAGRGALSTPEAVAAEMTYGVTRALSDPNMPMSKRLELIAERGKETSEGFASVNTLMGNIASVQTSVVALDDLVTRVAKMQAEAAKAGMPLEDFLKSEQGKRILQGGDTDLMTKATRTQQAAAMTMDSGIKTFNAAAKINEVATKAFEGAVDKFGDMVGFKKPAGGTPGAGGGGGAAAGGAASIPGQAGKLLDFIGKIESGGNYNKLVGGKNADLTNMTLAEVQALQSTMIGQGHESTAVGKYQIVQGTLQGLIKELGLDPNSTKFDAAMQDRLGMALMKRRGFDSYSKGTMSKEDFLFSLSQEWAALPKDASGQSYYQGQGSNRALVGYNEAIGQFATGGIASGPKSGYTSVLHGTEAVVPLSNGNSIPVDVQGMTDSMSRQVDILVAQMARLDEMVSAMREQTAVSKRILQATHA